MHHALITAKKNKAEELVHYLAAQSECSLGALIGYRSAPCGPASAHCDGITSMVKTQEKGPIPSFFFPFCHFSLLYVGHNTCRPRPERNSRATRTGSLDFFFFSQILMIALKTFNGTVRDF